LLGRGQLRAGHERSVRRGNGNPGGRKQYKEHSYR